ncbi:perforin-1-like [Lissotriton helveticus]
MMFCKGIFLPWACSLIPVLLFPLIRAQCTTGTAAQCSAAKFIPGHNLGGEGFDVITLQRKGAYVIDMESYLTKNETCTLCENSQLANQLQKVPLNVQDWRVDVRCSLAVTSTVYESSLSFANSTSRKIENDWRIGLDVMPVPGVSVGLVTAGSHSKLSEFATQRGEKDKYSYSTQETSCNVYRYRVHDFPKLSRTFSDQLKLLPKVYNSTTHSRFRNLIDIYGTHYIKQVRLGGSVSEVTALRTCEVTLDELSTEEVKDCLGVEASLSIKGISVESAIKKCKVLQEHKLLKQKFSEKYMDRRSDIVGGSLDAHIDLLFPRDNQVSPYEDWIMSLKGTPDVTTYSLAALHELVPYGDSRKQLLKKAITDYIIEKSLTKTCPACPSGASPDPQVKCNCVCPSSSLLSTGCCAKNRGLATMTVVVVGANGLKGDAAGNPPDPYVKVFYDGKEYRTNWVKDNANPRWNAVFSMGMVTLSPSKQLVLEAWDKDVTYDDHLGSCHVAADAAPGERPKTCYLKNGNFQYTYRIECGPQLAGSYCTDPQPSV